MKKSKQNQVKTGKKSKKRLGNYVPEHTCFTGNKLLDAIVESSQGGGCISDKDSRRDIKQSGYVASVGELVKIYGNQKISVRRAQLNPDGSYPDMDGPEWKFICRGEVLNGRADERTHTLFLGKIGTIVGIENVCVTYRVAYDKDRDVSGTFFASFTAANGVCYTMSRAYDRLKSHPEMPNIWVAEKTGQIFNMAPNAKKQGLPITQYQRGRDARKYNAVTINGRGYQVHHLVADTWCQGTKERWPDSNAASLVRNHIDENKENNAAENLEFCSARYNVRYSRLAELARKKLPSLFSLPEYYDILEKFARDDGKENSNDAFLDAIAHKNYR